MKHPTRTRRADGGRQQAFKCKHCGRMIDPAAYGTKHRNHCPHCLWSRHVDGVPGDRSAMCGGAMEPIAVWVKPDGEWSIVHRCTSCGRIKPNRIAGDDSEWALMRLAARALARPPFPID